MVAGLPAQFLLLTWKNILLQRRKICVTVFEIVLPLVFPIVLVIIRNLADLEPKLEEATTYEKERIYYYSSNQVLYAPNTTVISGIMNETFSILKGFLAFLFLFFKLPLGIMLNNLTCCFKYKLCVLMSKLTKQNLI